MWPGQGITAVKLNKKDPKQCSALLAWLHVSTNDQDGHDLDVSSVFLGLNERFFQICGVQIVPEGLIIGGQPWV
jgi:hypothetical protein